MRHQRQFFAIGGLLNNTNFNIRYNLNSTFQSTCTSNEKWIFKFRLIWIGSLVQIKQIIVFIEIS